MEQNNLPAYSYEINIWIQSKYCIRQRWDKGVLWKDWCWSWSSNTLATSCEELTHWKRLWCWEGLEAGREGNYRGRDGWMASLTQWTWVWVNSGSWWWTGQPGVLRFMGSQRVVHDWAAELNWTETKVGVISITLSQTHAVLTKPCDATNLLDSQRPAWMGVPRQRSKKLFFLTRHLNLLMMPPISNSLHQKFPYLHFQMCKINHVLWKRGCPASQLCNWGTLMPSKHRRPQLFLKNFMNKNRRPV